MDLQLIINEELCTKCGSCINDCPSSILEFAPDYPQANKNKTKNCIQCQHCLAVCPTGALSILGLSPAQSLPVKKDMLPTAEQIEQLIKSRRSIRKYQQKPLAKETIDHLMTATGYAPTGANRRKCLFSVVDDQDVMQKIREETIEALRAKAKAREFKKGEEVFIAIVRAWDKGHDVLFRNAPHMLLTSSPKGLTTTLEDGIVALSYFELLAASMNIGTLWDGLLHWAYKSIIPEIPEKIGIPESHYLNYVMLFGKPAVKYHRTVQRDDTLVQKVTFN